MKNLKARKTTIFGLFPLIIMLLLVSCGPGPQDRVRREQLNEVKQSVEEDLFALRGDIIDRIQYLEQEIEEADDQVADNLTDLRDDLEYQRDILDEEIENVRDATLDNWDEVVAQVSATATSVRTRTNEITREVNQMLDNLQNP